MKKTTVREILSKNQMQAVIKIMKNNPSAGRDSKLMEYLKTQREPLELKGIRPEYLFYVIQYLEMEATSELNEEENQNVKNN